MYIPTGNLAGEHYLEHKNPLHVQTLRATTEARLTKYGYRNSPVFKQAIAKTSWQMIRIKLFKWVSVPQGVW